nr:hypothetical protein OH826_35145 [Streptomyces sp. NBC_00899]
MTAGAAGGDTGSGAYPVPPGKTLRLTDLVPENPQGDSGTVTIAVGGKTLLAPALENFREQDFHWASAILVTEGQKVTITVSCRQPGTPAGFGSGPDELHGRGRDQRNAGVAAAAVGSPHRDPHKGESVRIGLPPAGRGADPAGCAPRSRAVVSPAAGEPA